MKGGRVQRVQKQCALFSRAKARGLAGALAVAEAGGAAPGREEKRRGGGREKKEEEEKEERDLDLSPLLLRDCAAHMVSLQSQEPVSHCLVCASVLSTPSRASLALLVGFRLLARDPEPYTLELSGVRFKFPCPTELSCHFPACCQHCQPLAFVALSQESEDKP